MSMVQAGAAERARLTQKAALASVAVAAILLMLKGLALWRTDSVAVLGSLADTGLDMLASLVTLMGVRFAALPADREHRFGHGKAEALSALFQVTLITLAALGLAWESIRRIGADHRTQAAETGIGVSLLAIVLSLALVSYQKRVIARTGSLAISTDNVHYRSDLYLNLSVIVALALDHFLNLSGADALFGLGIAVWLAWSAWSSAWQAVDSLMDKEWSLEERRHFLEVASRHPLLHSIHDMRTRSSGTHRFVQFHVMVDPEMTVRDAHVVMDEIEAELAKEFPGVEILIHPDPIGHVEPEGDPLRGMEARALLSERRTAVRS